MGADTESGLNATTAPDPAGHVAMVIAAWNPPGTQPTGSANPIDAVTPITPLTS